MWIFDKTLLLISLRTLLVYLGVLLGMRLTGKREVGQMTPFDLVLLLLIANAVQNAMTGPDVSLTGGWVAAGTLFVANAIITKLTYRNRKIRNLMEGTPTLLIHKGKVLGVNLVKEQITHEELLQALREHGIADVEEVQTAMIEIDGSISVLKKDEMPSLSRPHHHIRFLKRKS